MSRQDAVHIISPTGEPDADAALLAGIRAYLARHEAINSIQLAGFLASDAFDEQTPVLVATIAEDVAGVATAFPGFNLLLSHIEHEDAVAALAIEAVRRELDIPGVMGPSRSALAFAEQWQRLTGGSFAPGMAQRILAASTVRPPGDVPGTWREITSEDHAPLVSWLSAFGVEVGDVLSADAKGYGEAMLRSRDGVVIWLDENGTLVSVACYKAPTLSGIRIGPVYTPPENRRKGYAGAVTAAATRLLLDWGYAFACLYTDAANLTSNRVYEAIGYEFVADSMQYRFTGRTGS